MADKNTNRANRLIKEGLQVDFHGLLMKCPLKGSSAEGFVRLQWMGPVTHGDLSVRVLHESLESCANRHVTEWTTGTLAETRRQA